MDHRVTRFLPAVAAVVAAGLLAGVCLAQATQPAPAENPQGTENVIPRQEKAGAPPAASKGGAPQAGPGVEAPATGPAGPPARTQESPWGSMWWYVVLLGGFVLLYVWMGRGRRKQEAKRRELIASLKKNDKVVTIGGIMGTVIETKPDEVTIKVDETNNVRMKFARWAIRGVGEEAKQGGGEDDKK